MAHIHTKDHEMETLAVVVITGGLILALYAVVFETATKVTITTKSNNKEIENGTN